MYCVQQGYSVVWTDRWNEVDNEMGGVGRCLTTHEDPLTMERAIHLAHKWASLAWRMWGPGEVVVLDEDLVPVLRLDSRRPVATTRPQLVGGC